MGTDRLVPWFPAWGVEFANPIENIFSVVSVINEWRVSNRWMMLSYEAAASEVHLWTAWYALRSREISGKMIAKTPDTEFLRLIAGTRQINKAFDRAGIALGDIRAWIILLPDSDLGEEFGDYQIPLECYNDSTEDAIRLIEHLNGSLISKRPVASRNGLEKIGSEIGEISGSLQLEDLFLRNIALSDLK